MDHDFIAPMFEYDITSMIVNASLGWDGSEVFIKSAS